MSETTTHTPGPWRTGRKVFRTIYCEEHGTEGWLIGVMDRREDATLVAAAPEMLEALRVALRAMSAFTHEQIDAKEQMRAAIAKAKP